ncbi:GDSL-type esterase/lipase family protein [Pseudomonas silvicola]|nr:GDSL-type esterase/lipase family protein [Pseudomonas silvicola]
MACPFKAPQVITLLGALGTLGATPLPLDVIGLYVTAASPVAGGTGYRVDDTLTLPGGVTLTVAKVGADARVDEVVVKQPLMHACGPNEPVAAQSAEGSGATFSLTWLAATGYGTRQLTRCYSGPALTVQRSDTDAALPIGLLADGGLDTAALDRFTVPAQTLRGYATFDAGVTPRVAVWHDQGGGGNDAVQPDAQQRPTLTADRLHGNSRAVLFDAHGGAGDWDPANTFLTLPAGVALQANHFTLAVIGAATSVYAPAAFVAVGDIAGKNAGLEFGHYSAQPTACDGAGDNAYAAVVPTETPAVIVCTADAHGKVIDMLGTTSTAVGGNDSPLSGGSLGLSGEGRSGLVNLTAAIIVPWPLDAATRAALGASLQGSFGLTPPTQGVIVVLGDSHSDGSGAPFQQGWPHQMITLLGRNDVQLVNGARYGGRLATAIEQWKQYAQPNLLASAAAHKIVILQGGYNDQLYGQSANEIIATYQRGAVLAHMAGAKAVCVANVLRNAPAVTNHAIAQVNAALRQPLAGCDAVIDWASVPAFNQQSGTYPPPLFAADRVHLTAEGQARQARLAAEVIGPLLR